MDLRTYRITVFNLKNLKVQGERLVIFFPIYFYCGSSNSIQSINHAGRGWYHSEMRKSLVRICFNHMHVASSLQNNGIFGNHAHACDTHWVSYFLPCCHFPPRHGLYKDICIASSFLLSDSLNAFSCLQLYYTNVIVFLHAGDMFSAWFYDIDPMFHGPQLLLIAPEGALPRHSRNSNGTHRFEV